MPKMGKTDFTKKKRRNCVKKAFPRRANGKGFTENGRNDGEWKK